MRFVRSPGAVLLAGLVAGLASALAACSKAPSPDQAVATPPAFVTPTTAGQLTSGGEAQPAAAPPQPQTTPPDVQPTTSPPVAATIPDTARSAPAVEPPAPLQPSPAPTRTPPPGAASPASGATHIALKYLIGDVDPASDPMFARIPDKYVAGSRVWGHKDAVAAFVRMAESAARNGYKLKIVSAFRSFSDQKKIWEDKWSGKTLVGGKKLNKTLPDARARARKILEFSSMPTTSRHHWGTDFDLNSLENKYFATKDGKRLYDWLTQHAGEFGFCQVYSPKGDGGRASGYEEEKWHWSYLPVATWYLKQYPVDVGYDRITGFEGSESAKAIDVIPNYVESINPECRQ